MSCREKHCAFVDIKAPVHRPPSLTFKDAVGYTQPGGVIMDREGDFLEQLQVGRAADEYSDKHLKGIQREGVTKIAPVVYSSAG